MTVGLAMVGLLVLQPALEILEAQNVAEKSAVTQDPLAVAVPFGPGERMEYQVKLGIFSAGEAYIAVDGLEQPVPVAKYRFH